MGERLCTRSSNGNISMKTIRVLPFQPDAPKSNPKSNPNLDDQANDVTSRPTTPASYISIDVSGSVFRANQSVLRLYPNTLLGRLTTEDDAYDRETKRFCYDRNATLFHFILDFYRHGRLHFPHDLCGLMIKDELEFWEIPDRFIAKCCWNQYASAEENLRIMTHLEALFDRDASQAPRRASVLKRLSLRQRIWLFLEDPRSSKSALVSIVLKCW